MTMKKRKKIVGNINKRNEKRNKTMVVRKWLERVSRSVTIKVQQREYEKWFEGFM